MISGETSSLEARVFNALEDAILSGKYKPGDSLTELSASKELGVSRTPVREALHRLQEEGLVALIPNKGAVVIGVSVDDLIDIYKIRMRLEGLAASMAAERMTDEEKSALYENVELARYYVSKDNPEKLKELDTDFHEMIYRGCGSRTMYRTLAELHNSTKLYRKLSLSVAGRVNKSVDEHASICEAIKCSDTALVDKLSSQHVEAALNNLLTALGAGKEN